MKKWHYVSLRYDARNFPNLAKQYGDEFLKANLLCFCEQAEIEETIRKQNINCWVCCNKDDQHDKYMSVFDHVKEEELDKDYFYVNFFGEGQFKFKRFNMGDFHNIYEDFTNICHSLESGKNTIYALGVNRLIEYIGCENMVIKD